MSITREWNDEKVSRHISIFVKNKILYGIYFKVGEQMGKQVNHHLIKGTFRMMEQLKFLGDNSRYFGENSIPSKIISKLWKRAKRQSLQERKQQVKC